MLAWSLAASGRWGAEKPAGEKIGLSENLQVAPIFFTTPLLIDVTHECTCPMSRIRRGWGLPPSIYGSVLLTRGHSHSSHTNWAMKGDPPLLRVAETA